VEMGDGGQPTSFVFAYSHPVTHSITDREEFEEHEIYLFLYSTMETQRFTADSPLPHD